MEILKGIVAQGDQNGPDRRCPNHGAGLPPNAYERLLGCYVSICRESHRIWVAIRRSPICFRNGECPICSIRFLSSIDGNFRHRWIAVWRQEREARPVLINPAISNVERNTEPTARLRAAPRSWSGVIALCLYRASRVSFSRHCWPMVVNKS